MPNFYWEKRDLIKMKENKQFIEKIVKILNSFKKDKIRFKNSKEGYFKVEFEEGINSKDKDSIRFSFLYFEEGVKRPYTIFQKIYEGDDIESFFLQTELELVLYLLFAEQYDVGNQTVHTVQNLIKFGL